MLKDLLCCQKCFEQMTRKRSVQKSQKRSVGWVSNDLNSSNTSSEKSFVFLGTLLERKLIKKRGKITVKSVLIIIDEEKEL